VRRAGTPPGGPATPSSLAEAVVAGEDRMARFFEEQRIPGLAWGVVSNGALVGSGAMGVSDLSSGAPVTTGSLFRIASVTKSITACCVLLLRDEGRLGLDDPVAAYLPEMAAVRALSRDAPPITLRHLLTMSGGLVEDDPWADRQLAMTSIDFGRLLAAGVGVDTVPGTSYQYSNLGYALLGRVVTVVSGSAYPHFVGERILQPLSMTQSSFEIAEVPDRRRVRGYRLTADGYEEQRPLGDGAFGSMGGLITSVEDFSRYLSWQLDAWPARDDVETGPLSRASRREMQQIWRSIPLDREADPWLTAQGYGYGFRVVDHRDGDRIVGHSGGLPGFGSHIAMAADRGIGVLGFANLTYAPMYRVIGDVLEILRASNALPRRASLASIEIRRAREIAVRLYEEWDDALARSVAAGNLFCDRSLEERAHEVAVVRQSCGAVVEIAPAGRQGALRGRWQLHCEHGTVLLEIWLAPTRELSIQHLRFTVG